MTETLSAITATPQEPSALRVNPASTLASSVGVAAHVPAETAALDALAAPSRSSLNVPVGTAGSTSELVDTIMAGDALTAEPDDMAMQEDSPDYVRAGDSEGVSLRDVEMAHAPDDRDNVHADADADASTTDGARDEEAGADMGTPRPTSAGGKRKRQGVSSEQPPKRGKVPTDGVLEPESSSAASRRSSRSNQPPRKARDRAERETPDAPVNKRQTRSRKATKS